MELRVAAATASIGVRGSAFGSGEGEGGLYVFGDLGHFNDVKFEWGE